jgi:hypothetical protein
MRKRWIILAAAVLLAAGAGYTGYWFWLAHQLSRNLAAWTDYWRNQGYRISFDQQAVEGYPFDARLLLRRVSVQPPAVEPPWRAWTDSLDLSIAPWQPLTLHSNGTAPRATYNLEWSVAGRDFSFAVEGLDVTVRFPAGDEAPEMTWQGHDVGLFRDGRYAGGAVDLAGRVDLLVPASNDKPTADFHVWAYSVNCCYDRPTSEHHDVYGPSLEGQLMGPILPGPITNSLDAWRRRGGYLKLTRIEANLAPPEIRGAATIALDADLQPIAAGTATLRRYDDFIDGLVAESTVTPALGVAAKVALGATARPAADGSKELEAHVPVTVQDGYLSVGPVRLLALPRIIWQ